MSTQSRINQELDRLGPLASGGSQTLQLGFKEGTLLVELKVIGPLACAFTEFRLQTDKLSNATADELKGLAERLASQLNYLLESISPVEIDRDGCSVQLRSKPPQKDDDGTRYYELVARRGELTLSRFAKVPGQMREIVPANVTREVLARLADDFVAAVA